jgi:hypothetical protein
MAKAPKGLNAMRGLRSQALGLIAAMSIAGCQGGPSKQRSVAVAEPGLSGPVEPGTVVADGQTARAVTFVDRHPLFYKPRDYYESSGSNKIVKSAAAVFVGVPVGFFGELKQIVVGAPVESRY